MANPKHVAKLREGVAAWNEWRENSRVRPDLEGEDLRSAVLMGADLKGANLKSANLSGANLSEAMLISADLPHADLSKAHLGFAFLDRARLSNADMEQAHLRHATLTKANLRYVDLSGADLSLADLSGADLTGADLTGADLSRASLLGTDLELAKLTDCLFVATVITGVNLSKSEGLEEVVHTGPSSIGIDTISLSEGRIPKAFLRGCGVPEELIQSIPSLFAPGKPNQYYSCFISYSHADKAFARLLHDRLQGRGIRCWLDEHQLLPGDHVHHAIDEGIRLWDKVLLCCSEAALNSWWVDKEIQKALMKEEQLWKERKNRVLAIIPLNLDGYLFKPDWTDWKAQHLKERLAANFVGWESSNKIFETEFDRLVKALKAGDIARSSPPKSLL